MPAATTATRAVSPGTTSAGVGATHGGRVRRRGRFLAAADPTRTMALRAAMIRDGNKRWEELKRDIRITIVDHDALGLQPDVMAFSAAEPGNNGSPGRRIRGLAPAGRKAFAFETSEQKVASFMGWLLDQQDAGVLDITYGQPLGAAGRPWSDVYVDTAYQRGIRTAHADFKKIGLDTDAGSLSFGGFNQPIHAERLGILHSRTFEDLKTVTQAFNADTRRLITDTLTDGLTRGIAEGKSPRTVARELYRAIGDRVDHVGKARFRTIARTEIIRAHHTATVTQYESLEQLTGRELLYDWVLGGAPCPICEQLSFDGPYKREVIGGMIPAHPNCVCTSVPIIHHTEGATLVLDLAATPPRRRNSRRGK